MDTITAYPKILRDIQRAARHFPVARWYDEAKMNKLFGPHTGVRTVFEPGELPSDEFEAIQSVVRRVWRRPPKSGTCYQTAAMLALHMEESGYEGYDYTQGIAGAYGMYRHAWLSTPSGRVVDLVWRLPAQHPYRLRAGIVRHGIWGRWNEWREAYVGVRYSTSCLRGWWLFAGGVDGCIGQEWQVMLDGGWSMETKHLDPRFGGSPG